MELQGGPIGIGGGFGIGFAIGFPIGVAIGASFACHKQYPRYQRWLESDEGERFSKDLVRLLSSDALATHVNCPITQMPVLKGVRTPNGQLYEKSALVKWVNQHGTDPITREKITIDQLVTDEEASLENAKSTRNFLIKIKDDAINLQPGLQNGIEDTIADIEEQVIQRSNNKLVKIQKEWQGKKISYSEYQAKKAEIDSKYQL